MSKALLDVADGYAEHPDKPPTEAAEKHVGVPGVAWLLPVALVRREPRSREEHVQELTAAAEVPNYSRPACLAWVELAARLFAVGNAAEAIHEARLCARWHERSRSSGPRLLGLAPVDGLVAAVWALQLRATLPEAMAQLLASGGETIEPWVSAAAGGPLGLRDGCRAIPAIWHRQLPRSDRRRCFEVAQGLDAVASQLDQTDDHRPTLQCAPQCQESHG